jgi:hypothetical protein
MNRKHGKVLRCSVRSEDVYSIDIYHPPNTHSNIKEHNTANTTQINVCIIDGCATVNNTDVLVVLAVFCSLIL